MSAPIGIDIRDGQQLACITCALCIDACDDVMEKIGKPRGLIDYIALSDETRERAGGARARLEACLPAARDPLYHALGAGGLGLVFALFIRPEIEMTVAPVRNPDLRHAVGRLHPQHLRCAPAEQAWRGPAVPHLAHRALDPAVQLEGTPYETVTVPANETYLQRVYVIAPPDSVPAERRAHRVPFLGRGSDVRRPRP